MPNGYGIPGNVGGPLDPLSLDYFDQNPDAAFEDWMRQMGVAGNDPYSRFIEGNKSRYYNDYQASLARDPLGRAASGDPMLYFRNFLSSINPKADFNIMGPSQRGISQRQSAPPMRWLTSVI